MKRSLVLPVFLLLAGCGGESALDPSMPDVRGAFEGTWDYSFTVVGTGESVTVSCAGRVMIASQSGDSFVGEFAVDASSECPSASGVVNGAVFSDGSLAFELEVEGSGVAGFESVTGCVYVEGRTSFLGVLDGDELTARARATFDCPAPNGMIICNDVDASIRVVRR
jgi:hypothetical protein